MFDKLTKHLPGAVPMDAGVMEGQGVTHGSLIHRCVMGRNGDGAE